jgi:hypothetical protein
MIVRASQRLSRLGRSGNRALGPPARVRGRTRFGPGRPEPAGGRATARGVPEDVADDGRVVDDGDDPHGIVANGTAKRIHMPNSENEVAPAF